MLLGPILLTWILVGTVTHRAAAKARSVSPRAPVQAVAGPHKMAVFHSPAACELYRQTMQQLHQQAVPSPTQPAVTVRKEFTFTCQESEEAL